MTTSVSISTPTDRELSRRLLLLAGPVIATNASRTVMSFVDFFMVSGLGTKAQAAVSPATLVVFCPIVFGMGMMSAVNTFAAQSFGRERKADCAAYAWQGIYLSLLLGTLVLPGWFLIEPLFASAGADADIIEMQVIYTEICLWSIAPSIISLALSNFFTAIHRPSVGLFAMVVSNVVNLAGNYVLIYGKLGFPELGIAGSAWATLGASVLQALILLAVFLAPAYRREFQSWRVRRLDSARLMALLRVGTPVAVLSASDIVTWTLFTIYLVGHFGEVQLAAHNICIKWLEISFMPALGVGMALTAMVGKMIGEHKHDVARRAARVGAFFIITYMVSVGLVFAAFGKHLANILSIVDDPQVIYWASRLLILYAFFQFFDALHIAYAGALRGAGDNTWPAVVWVICALTFLLGGGWLMTNLRPQWGLLAPWSACIFYVCVLGTVMWARWRFGPWERIELLDTLPAT